VGKPNRLAESSWGETRLAAGWTSPRRNSSKVRTTFRRQDDLSAGCVRGWLAAFPLPRQEHSSHCTGVTSPSDAGVRAQNRHAERTRNSRCRPPLQHRGVCSPRVCFFIGRPSRLDCTNPARHFGGNISAWTGRHKRWMPSTVSVSEGPDMCDLLSVTAGRTVGPTVAPGRETCRLRGRGERPPLHRLSESGDLVVPRQRRCSVAS
jgi:hypothetical protein